LSKNIVAFIPLKLNNQRLPGKNLKKFSNGVPLVNYILNSLSSVEGISNVYVYCSDDSVVDYLPDHVTFLKRSPSLDTDSTLINDVMACFAQDVVADAYIMLHATAPFLKPESIQASINALSGDVFDSVLTVQRKQEFLWLDTSAPSNYSPESIPRTQDLDPYFVETTGLYGYTFNLAQKGRRIGDNPRLIVVDAIEATDINNAVDFAMANALIEAGAIHE